MRTVALLASTYLVEDVKTQQKRREISLHHTHTHNNNTYETTSLLVVLLSVVIQRQNLFTSRCHYEGRPHEKL